MRAPYAGIPLPSFISNLRIKSRLTYIFASDCHIGTAEFFDFKILGLAKIIFWNRQTGRRNVYHAIMPPRRRFVPTNTDMAVCASYRKSRFIKVSWTRRHGHISLSFNVHGDSARQDAAGFITSVRDDPMHTDLMTVNPSPASNRCSATWLTTMSVTGTIETCDAKEKSLRRNAFLRRFSGGQTDRTEGLALMILNRTYYKMLTKSVLVTGIGKLSGRRLIFTLQTSNMDAADQDRYNNNMLVIEGSRTLLPPVYITHPFGLEGKWIIQDTESMVDLTFTPISVNRRNLDIIALRNITVDIYGSFDGALLTQDGEKLSLKNFQGLIRSNTLRL